MSQLKYNDFFIKRRKEPIKNLNYQNYEYENKYKPEKKISEDNQFLQENKLQREIDEIKNKLKEKENSLMQQIQKYNEISKKFNRIEKENSKLKDEKSKFEEIEKKNNDYQIKINILEEENRNLKEKINSLKNIEDECNKQKIINNNLNEQYTNALDSNSKLEKENNNLLSIKKILENENNKIKKENKELKEKNNIYENNINKYKIELNNTNNNFNYINNKYESSQKKLKEIKESLNSKENELNLLIEKNKKSEIEYKNMIDIYKNSEKNLNKNLENKKKEIDEIKKELKDTHSKFDGAINHYEEMGQKLKEQEKEMKEIKELSEKEKNENIKLKEEQNKINDLIKTTKTKEDYLKNSSEEYYDVVIDINSINSLKNEGWEIKYNKKRKEIYDKIIGEETIKIGVLGLNNVGKSYLLSKIVKVDIPTGYSIETKGISIKYSEGGKGEQRGICILDSAGFETPLLKEQKKNISSDKEEGNNETAGNIENKEEKKNSNLEYVLKYDEIEDELSRDKAQTERFIEQLIISLSDMIILVVGKLTRTEQRLITRIKNMARKNDNNKIKSIIIVHNLAQYHKIEEVQNHISRYLERSATFKLKSLNVYGIDEYTDRNYFVEQSDENEDIEIFHYIMAKEGTEAGNYYNNLTMELIKRQYNSFNQRRKIDIPKQIINLFSELSTDILGEKMKCQKLESNENIIKLSNIENDDNKKANNFHVQSAYIDQDGNYLQNKGKFEPKYSLYFYKEPKKKEEEDDENDDEDQYDNYLLLRLEIPGNIEKLTARTTDPQKEKYKGIVIKVLKKRDQFDEESKKDFTIIYDNRNYDEFSYFIELKRNFELSGSVASGFTNIYTIRFDKRNKENSKKENIVDIASGVYIMKFKLTDRSYVQHK